MPGLLALVGWFAVSWSGEDVGPSPFDSVRGEFPAAPCPCCGGMNVYANHRRLSSAGRAMLA